jgi:alpha-L-fucosidase 2
MTVHNDWRRMGVAVCGDFRLAPVQVDANMGITAAMQEMVMYSTKDTIFVMQAVPDAWKKGEVGPLLAKGNIEVTIEWDRHKNYGCIRLRNKGLNATKLIQLPSGMAFDNNTPLVKLKLKSMGMEHLNFMLNM